MRGIGVLMEALQEWRDTVLLRRARKGGVT
jgi:hypothetical protein